MAVGHLAAYAGLAGGTLAAKACHSSWDQASVFTSTRLAVDVIFCGFLAGYVNSGPRFALYYLAQLSAGYTAGVLMTRVICNEQISWRSAVTSMFVSRLACCTMVAIFMNKEQVAALKV
jgi:hypothetical protein